MESQSIAEAAADTADPRAGLRAIATLRSLTEAWELRQIEAALRSGMSWSEIGDALQISRQAVHKKYAKRIDPTIPVPRRSS